MLALPFPATDELKLADWLELYALLSPAGISSRGYLERSLRSSAVLSNDTAIEQKCVQVFSELKQREKSAHRAYPFESKGIELRLKSSLEDFPAYAFCLCLSFFQWQQQRASKIFPRRMFEALACTAAGNYIHGEVLRFASPREQLSKEFKKAVTELCLFMGEGNGFRDQPTLSSKDDTLDVVARRNFPDALPGKLLLFGQCASGNDWEDKIDELQPRSFCEDWMLEVPVSPIIKAFFIPHCVNLQKRNKISRRAGIVFDRCRIAYWVHQQAGFSGKERYLNWCRTVLAKASA